MALAVLWPGAIGFKYACLYIYFINPTSKRTGRKAITELLEWDEIRLNLQCFLSSFIDLSSKRTKKKTEKIEN